MKRVIVTGCRHWRPEALTARVVERLRDRFGSELILVHGAAPGVDNAFDLAGIKAGVKRDPHPADWLGLGSRAGPIRNQAMVSKGAELVIACHRGLAGSKGTRDCVRRALDAGIPVYLIDSEDAEPKRIASLVGM